jgi:hypothetical protein
LLIHSAIALDDAEITQLETLKTPKIMIVPNQIKRIDAKVDKERYPESLVVTLEVAKLYVEEVVSVDVIAEELLPNYGIVCHQPMGIRPQELMYELSLSTGCVISVTHGEPITTNCTQRLREAAARLS